MTSCPGCGAAKLSEDSYPICPKRKYCDDCYLVVTKQTADAEWKFRFERKLRTPCAEWWMISHPDAFGDIAEAFAFLTSEREVYVHVYVFPDTLKWEEGIAVVLPNGVAHKETHLEIFQRTILRHLVVGLAGPGDHKLDSVTLWSLADRQPILSWPPLPPISASSEPNP